MDLNYFHLLPELQEISDSSVLKGLFKMANKDGVSVVEAPSTPGRPVFNFSVGSRKNYPSKWEDAEKWVISSPAAHGFVQHQKEQRQDHQGNNDHSKAITVVSMDQDHIHNIQKPFKPSHVPLLLKDKLTNGEYSRFKCVVPIKEEFALSPMKDASTEVQVQVQVQTTGSRSRCPSPYKSVSPPRHTTPASMSGPLAAFSNSTFDMAELQECHLAKLDTCNWSSVEEEEEDVSKSLRHFQINNNHQSPKTIQPACWEQQQQQEPTSHLRCRYQREEAKIQAWVNLQNAKAEAETRKLEVKIQKMRSKFEEKMMKRMASVDRKAQELRAAAQYDHKVQSSMKTKESLHTSGSCSCFPCSPRHLK